MTRNKQNYMFAILSILVVLFAYIMNSYADEHILMIVNFLGISIILSVSLNLTNGFTGLFSLGHPAFMAIGGYTTAILTFPLSKRELFLPDFPQWIAPLQLSFAPALLIGGIVTAIIAMIVGFSVLRLKGHYLAVATMGFLIVVQIMITSFDSITRGPQGLNGLEEFTNIYWIYSLVLVAIYVAWKVKFSSLGRSMFAIREDEIAAKSLGINLFFTKNLAFVVGAFFAGISGGLWAHLVTALTPNTFSLIMSFNIILIIVIGGAGSITGSIVATIFFALFTEFLKPIEETFSLFGMSQIITSIILILILIFKPTGLFGSNEPSFLLKK